MNFNYFFRVIFTRRLCSSTVLLISSCGSLPSKNTSDSQFFTDFIHSKSLGEYRKHNVYLPANFDSENEYKILYSTDGNVSKTVSFYKIRLSMRQKQLVFLSHT
jgi:hypothetical protein